MNKRIAVKCICMLLTVTLLLCGCSGRVLNSSKDVLSQHALDDLREWLEKDCSFSLSYQYMNLAVDGMSQRTEQTFAADGKWYFVNQREVWDHTAGYEAKDIAEFYYCYEDSELVCYSSVNGDIQQPVVLTDQDKAEMDASKAYIIGMPGIFPDYVQNFSVVQEQDVTILSFELPVEKVLDDATLLSAFVNNVFALSGAQYKSEYDAKILCEFKIDADTQQPQSLSYDFSQIKPYVLSEGTQSGEYALDADFMTMTCAFDYHFVDTIELPTHLIP